MARSLVGRNRWLMVRVETLFVVALCTQGKRSSFLARRWAAGPFRDPERSILKGAAPLPHTYHRTRTRTTPPLSHALDVVMAVQPFTPLLSTSDHANHSTTLATLATFTADDGGLVV